MAHGKVVTKAVEEFMAVNLPILPKVNAFAFGFPCNDYSHVGERKGIEGEYGKLYRHGVEVLAQHKTRWFLAENVGGLRSAGDGAALERIMRELSEAGPGYRLTVHKYRFEEYGVPQRRHRIILVGISQEEAKGLIFQVPKTTTMINSSLHNRPLRSRL